MSLSSLTNYTIANASARPRRAIGRLNPLNTVRWRCQLSPQSREVSLPRRQANYEPSLWNYDFIQSLKSTHKDARGMEAIEDIKHDVKQMVECCTEPVALMELVDSLQRLGVSYQFEREIRGVLDSMIRGSKGCEGLHATALRFRLLRQHGYDVSPDAFNVFTDESGKFKRSLAGDFKGILSLYEASHLVFKGEDILDEAKSFTTYHLKESTKMMNLEPSLARQVAHALELPLSKRMLRFEARSYIDFYERMPGHNPYLLKLSRLDYNNVQSLYQAEVRKMSRWWRNLELAENLKFSRDRLMENYLWTTGINFYPHFSLCRVGLTKINCLITTIDDVYDVYGTVDELELFTKAVDKWDVGYIDHLPQYMKICFLALYNTTNEFVYDFMREKGSNILPYLTAAWADLCKAYLVEAKWFYNGYIPTLEEYLENACTSISGHVILVHAHFFVQQNTKGDAVMNLHQYSNLIKMSSLILRLHDDLGTSKDEIERGDVPKSIQCRMKEKGVSEEAARQHIEDLLKDAWKGLHKECVEAGKMARSHPFVHCALNLARMAQFVYQHGDGHGFPARDYSLERVQKLMVESV